MFDADVIGGVGSVFRKGGFGSIFIVCVGAAFLGVFLAYRRI